MRKAFSLMEIMIAVIIISVVGLALLQVNSNSNNLYTIIFDRTKENQIATVGFVEFSDETDKKEQIVYEALKERYEIDNDDIMQDLKEYKIYTAQTLVNSISFSDEENSEEDEENSKSKKFTIDIYSINTKVNENSNRNIYSITTSGEL
jgi:prepilin-type N-terminal cleavage/methylation domain-containing protein